MVRAPCCDHKLGLKKGPWTTEEDQILISYVQKNGHPNWRALPKQAGLLRCGKSCRLRWINYLRPDIKRGNFTSVEEETIIQLHEELGNRWSAIAARLPGRTDNEIKNVWHTHLKKRLEKNQTKPNPKPKSKSKSKSKSKIKCESSSSSSDNITTSQSESGNSTTSVSDSNVIPSRTAGQGPMSLDQPSSSEFSTVTTDATTATTDREVNNNMAGNDMDSWDWNIPEIDESFWSDALSSDGFQSHHQVPTSSTDHVIEFNNNNGYGQNLGDAMEFWYDMFIEAGGQEELFTAL